MIWPNLLLITTCPSKTLLTSGNIGSLTLPLMTMSGICWVSCKMCWRRVLGTASGVVVTLWHITDPQGCNTVFFMQHPKPHNGTPCYGLHWWTFYKPTTHEGCTQPSNSSSIRLAKKALNRYYKWTDLLELYCIAMGKLCPSHILVSTYLHCFEQYCIPIISLNTSSRLDGKQHGFQPLTTLFKTHLMNHTLTTMSLTI